MLASFVAEELAPFKDADVDEVAVGVNPELVFEYQLPFSPAGFVEGQISEKVTTEYSYPAETLPTCHCEAQRRGERPARLFAQVRSTARLGAGFLTEHRP